MKKIILDIKPFQETLHASMCGPASLKIILAYYGIEKSEQELAILTRCDTEVGISDADIVDALESFRLKTFVKNEADFSDIEMWLEKKVPLIVNWFTRGRSDYDDSEVPDGHYSVVIGLDNTHIYLQDPEIGHERKIAREDFFNVWFDFSGPFLKKDELIIRQIIAVHK